MLMAIDKTKKAGRIVMSVPRLQRIKSRTVFSAGPPTLFAKKNVPCKVIDIIETSFRGTQVENMAEAMSTAATWLIPTFHIQAAVFGAAKEQ